MSRSLLLRGLAELPSGPKCRLLDRCFLSIRLLKRLSHQLQRKRRAASANAFLPSTNKPRHAPDVYRVEHDAKDEGEHDQATLLARW